MLAREQIDLMNQVVDAVEKTAEIDEKLAFDLLYIDNVKKKAHSKEFRKIFMDVVVPCLNDDELYNMLRIIMTTHIANSVESLLRNTNYLTGDLYAELTIRNSQSLVDMAPLDKLIYAHMEVIASSGRIANIQKAIATEIQFKLATYEPRFQQVANDSKVEDRMAKARKQIAMYKPAPIAIKILTPIKNDTFLGTPEEKDRAVKIAQSAAHCATMYSAKYKKTTFLHNQQTIADDIVKAATAVQTANDNHQVFVNNYLYFLRAIDKVKPRGILSASLENDRVKISEQISPHVNKESEIINRVSFFKRMFNRAYSLSDYIEKLRPR